MGRIREVLYLNPRDLAPDPRNPRSDLGDLAGLADTIREHGVLQPLGVVRESGAYLLVWGRRRREAAIKVGLSEVPCLLLEEQTPGERTLWQLIENVQRKALNDMEQGEAFVRMKNELSRGGAHGTSDRALNEAVAKKTGLSPRTVQRYAALCDLPESIQELIRREELTVTHAQHLLALGDPARQVEIAGLAVAEDVSAAELGRLCASLARNPNIDPGDALDKMRQGQAIDAIVPARVAVADRLPPRPSAGTDEDGDEGLWEDEIGDDGEFGQLSVATADGNRRFRVRSLDSFLDELGRLTRCVEDGDLAKMVEADPAGRKKAALIMRQLAYLSREVAALAQTEPG